MALKTFKKRLADLDRAFEEKIDALANEMRTAFAEHIGPLIPEGWVLQWHQSDEQFNDEDYYFGLDPFYLQSQRRPRKGKLLKEEVPTTYRTTEWGQQIDVFGEDAVYEYHLDDDCPVRKRFDEYSWGEANPGIINVGQLDGDQYDEDDGGAPQLGVTQKQLDALWGALNSLSENNYRRVFGDQADVTVYPDGRVVLK